jgi:hypothetical protein
MMGNLERMGACFMALFQHSIIPIFQRPQTMGAERFTISHA